ncbi:kinetochore Sim4 complex subunit FTA2-domain-containing protein [Xylaria sp. FL1042]|nr:kinetochore Sim4 complex subunit FTA2-domain-containing protein [Xylaria sp. FL1042]
MDIPPMEGIEGPKIGPFKNSGPKLNIRFLEKIRDGGDSWVWKVDIDGSVYALKMFKPKTEDFINPMHRQKFQKLGIVDEAAIFNALDPFANECRAYGRLKETKKTHIAVACYGYILLATETKDVLDDADFKKLEWVECRDEEHDAQASKPKARRIRALVKEYIETESSFSSGMIRKMLRNLKLLHKYGIVQRDIRQDNYREGKLVDFSAALTVPHFLLDKELGYNNLEEIYDYEVDDGYAFDNMIDDWSAETGTRIWTRFLPNFRYRERLRSEPKEKQQVGDSNSPTDDTLATVTEVYSKVRDQIKCHAADYDWKKGTQQKKQKTA